MIYTSTIGTWRDDEISSQTLFQEVDHSVVLEETPNFANK